MTTNTNAVATMLGRLSDGIAGIETRYSHGLIVWRYFVALVIARTIWPSPVKITPAAIRDKIGAAAGMGNAGKQAAKYWSTTLANLANAWAETGLAHEPVAKRGKAAVLAEARARNVARDALFAAVVAIEADVLNGNEIGAAHMTALLDALTALGLDSVDAISKAFMPNKPKETEAGAGADAGEGADAGDGEAGEGEAGDGETEAGEAGDKPGTAGDVNPDAGQPKHDAPKPDTAPTDPAMMNTMRANILSYTQRLLAADGSSRVGKATFTRGGIGFCRDACQA